MSEHDSLINLCFTEPGPLVPGGEDLHRHVLSSPLAPPHFTKSTLSDGLLQDNGPSYGSLDQQWQTCKMQCKKFHPQKYEQQTCICLSRSQLEGKLLRKVINRP